MPSTLAFHERPLLFGTPMVRAIIDRGKTQTRRLLKPEPEYRESVDDPSGVTGPGWYWHNRKGSGVHSQPRLADLYRMLGEWPQGLGYGRPGDRLWVREAFAWDDETKRFVYRADGGESPTGRWRPSIFMPRQACRLELELTAVRVEDVQAMTDDDARAEGIYLTGDGWAWNDSGWFGDPVAAYADLWDRINPETPWTDSPAVVVLTFRRLEVDFG